MSVSSVGVGKEAIRHSQSTITAEMPTIYNPSAETTTLARGDVHQLHLMLHAGDIVQFDFTDLPSTVDIP
jgi:hypothetical protein